MCLVLDYKKDYSAVYAETSCVVEWFALGSLLEVMSYKLEQINADYRFSHDGLTQMLSAWLKSGRATWFSLVRALRKMGRCELATKIAMKKGVRAHASFPYKVSKVLTKLLED